MNIPPYPYMIPISIGVKSSSFVPFSNASYKASTVSNAVKHGIFDSTANLLILNPSLDSCFPLVGVLMIKDSFPEPIKSGILFSPSQIFWTVSASTPFSFKNVAVPEVA